MNAMMNRVTRQASALGITALWLAVPGAEAQVQETWVARYDGPQITGLSSSDYVTDMVVRDGYVYVTGYEGLFGSDWATVKYDDAGQELWVQRYEDGIGQPNAMAVDAAGNVYVTGYNNNGNAVDLVTFKYSSNGVLLWEQRYITSGNNNSASDIAFDASGDIYISGASWIPEQEDFDLLLLKYEPDGNLLWDRTIDNGDEQTDSGYALTIDPDGNAIVAGFTAPNPYLVKYSPTGDLLWEDEHSGLSGVDLWRFVEADAMGNIYVLGEISPGGSANHIWTTKYDPDGNILWEQTYIGTHPNACYAGGLALMPDGGVVITGQSWDLPFHINIVTIRYSSDGAKLWQRNETAGYGNASGDDVAVDADGNIYVTGYGYEFSFWEDIITLGYSPDGDLLWTQIYVGPDYPAQSDYPHEIAVDEAANVFVAAHSWGDDSNDFTTIRYSTSAAQEISRVGVPANPDVFLPGVTTAPVIGQTWDPVIDHTTFVPASIADFMLVSIAPWEFDLGATGTLLCSLPFISVLDAPGPGLPFQVSVPDNSQFVGLSICTQGGSTDGASFFLTNALDITIGTF
jgi:uncharacterized delta-60 repeat protein